MFSIQKLLFCNRSFRCLILFTAFLMLLFPWQGSFAQGCSETGISKEEFAQRRKSLLMRMDSSSALVMKSKDAYGEYELMNYRQDKNFFYLAGIKDPGRYLLISKQGIDLDGRGRVKNTLFFAPSSSEMIKNIDEYSSQSDTILYTDEFKEVFNKVAGGISILYISAPDLNFVNDWLNDKPYFILTEVKKNLKQHYPGLKVKDASSLITVMRRVKSPAETEMTRKAILSTGNGIMEAMKKCRPGMKEYELQAMIEYEMIRSGSETRAFNSIIGSGENSLILHYNRNDCEIKKGDVVVMDVGAQYRGYAADITRTIPVSGRFTKEQKEIYKVVLDAQKEAIKMIRPGITTGDLDKKAEEIITHAGYKNYIRHGITHPVGLDVHDVSAGDTLVAGMIITVEPGIYIPANDEKLPQAYHGFGIRIEDDVLVTENGYEVLSVDIPKEVEEVEKIMKSQSHRVTKLPGDSVTL